MSEEGATADSREATAEHRRTRGELRASEQSLRRLHEIASDPDRPQSEKMEAMLAVGRERLDVAVGFLTRIEDGTQEIVELVGEHPELEPDATAPLSEAYCRQTIGREEPLAITDATAQGWEDDPAYEKFGLGCYFGATIVVDGERYGTVCFADTEPRERAFSGAERTFLDILTNWISYIIEQRQYEEEIRVKQRRLETVTENLPVVVFALDSEGTYTLVRGQGLESLGFDAERVVGESIFELYRSYPSVCSHARRALNGQRTHQTVDIDDVTLEIWYQPVAEAGQVTQVVGVARDITELTEYRERLSGMLELSRSLMQARSREEVAELTANAAQDVLGFDANAVRLYDADAERLELVEQATTGLPIRDRPAYDVGEGMPGTVFATGEPQVVEDLETVDVKTNTERLRSAMYYPMGVHGTISVASANPEAFDETDEQVLALLATAAAAACTRARRERQIRETREHVETVLERINGLIENTVEVLVGATTREELEAGVVSELAAAEPHTFAWIGRPDVTSDQLAPTEWDGETSVPVDRTFDLDESNPVGAAFASGTPQVLSRGEEGATALGCTTDGPETAIVVPLSYKETTYGVVAVFADRSGTFDEREQVVLSALGRAVANAINAIERGRILDADQVIEMEFAIDDDLLFDRLADECECRVEVADFDYRTDGRLRLYLTADDADGETLATLARDADEVTDVNLIVDTEDGCLLEMTVDGSIIERVSEFGAVVREVIAHEGITRLTAELPLEAEARELFELVADQHPATDLVGYHEHERPVQTRREFRAALADRFTDRQETALRTAYLGGFFDWPREIDGNDLADAMDVSRPTYHQHLRAAQQKVFEELFE